MNDTKIRDLPFIVDTNLLNTKKKDPSMNQLEEWFRDGVIDLHSTLELWNEARGHSVYSIFYQKATDYPALFAKSCNEADNEALRKKIETIVFPNGLTSQNSRVDVKGLFVAKMCGAIFVTNDGDSNSQRRGILGSRERLHREVGVEVMRPDEAVQIVRARISARDRMQIAVTELGLARSCY